MGQSGTETRYSLSTSVVLCWSHSTTIGHTLSFTCCCYQNYKPSKPGNLLRDSSSAPSEMEEQWIEKCSHFYGEMMVVCHENHSVSIM